MRKSEKLINRDKHLLKLIVDVCKDIRKQKGLSLKEFAEENDLVYYKVRNFENYRNNSGEIFLKYISEKSLKDFLKEKQNARIKRNMTKRQISIMTGYSEHQIHYFERGYNDSAILVYYYETLI